MYCKQCGTNMPEGADHCPACGGAQPSVVDRGGFGWGLLGYCIPVVGLVLYLVWKDSKPRTSKAAGIGALISVACVLVFYVAVFAVGFGGALLSPY